MATIQNGPDLGSRRPEPSGRTAAQDFALELEIDELEDRIGPLQPNTVPR